jgi:hypothetical protein
MKFTLFKKNNEIHLKKLKKKIKKSLILVDKAQKEIDFNQENETKERFIKIEEKIDYIICLFENIIEKINNN